MKVSLPSMAVARGGRGEYWRAECMYEQLAVGIYCKQEMECSSGKGTRGVRSLLTVVTRRSQEAVAVGRLWDRNAKRRY
jgi:hypothetical protein